MKRTEGYDWTGLNWWMRENMVHWTTIIKSNRIRSMGETRFIYFIIDSKFHFFSNIIQKKPTRRNDRRREQKNIIVNQTEFIHCCDGNVAVNFVPIISCFEKPFDCNLAFDLLWLRRRVFLLIKMQSKKPLFGSVFGWLNGVHCLDVVSSSNIYWLSGISIIVVRL